MTLEEASNVIVDMKELVGFRKNKDSKMYLLFENDYFGSFEISFDTDKYSFTITNN